MRACLCSYREWIPEEAAVTSFPITTYQPTYFVANRFLSLPAGKEPSFCPEAHCPCRSHLAVAVCSMPSSACAPTAKTSTGRSMHATIRIQR